MIDAFKDFKEEKSIDRPVMLGVLKDVFLTQLAKTYGSADNFDVIINVDKGDCEIYQNFEVVEEVEDPVTQITLDEIKAETGDDDYEIGLRPQALPGFLRPPRHPEHPSEPAGPYHGYREGQCVQEILRACG